MKNDRVWRVALQDRQDRNGRTGSAGRLSNLIVARAAFDVSVSLWPSSWIELRQDARIIEKHGARE